MNEELPIYTIEELEAANKYPPLVRGRYRFTTIERTQGACKAGNPRENITLLVHHRSDHSMKCYDNFPFYRREQADIDPAIKKKNIVCINRIKNYLKSVKREYLSDAFYTILRTEGRADFEVEEYTSTKTGKKGQKFVVPLFGYVDPEEIKSEISIPPSPNAEEKKEYNDDIPF